MPDWVKALEGNNKPSAASPPLACWRVLWKEGGPRLAGSNWCLRCTMQSINRCSDADASNHLPLGRPSKGWGETSRR